MKNRLISSFTRRFLYKHQNAACAGTPSRHFADKPGDITPEKKASPTEGQVEKKEGGLKKVEFVGKDDLIPDDYKVKKFSFNNAEAPPEYVDPESTDEHYHVKRAFRLLKLEAEKTWKKIQDPMGDYQGDSLFPTHVDVLVIGGGAIGTSVAYFLKQRTLDGCRVAVVDRDFTVNYDLKEYARASTTLSVGGVRQQFSLKENIEMSVFGADFLRNIKYTCQIPGEDPPEVNFAPNGYLMCASQAGAASLERNHLLQKELGAKNVLLTADQLKSRFPWLNTDGIELACLGLEKEGWFDPWLYLSTVKKKAISLGAEYVQGDVVNFIRRENTGCNVLGYDEGTYKACNECVVRDSKGNLRSITFAHCVIAAGAFSGQIARLLNIGDKKEDQGYLFVPIPVEPRKRYVYCFESPNGPGVNTPMVIDYTGTYFRREGLGNYYICGKSPTPEQEPSVEDLEVDYEYFNENIWPDLANRVKSFENLKVSNAWAGYYDYNYFDENALIGNHPAYFNIHFATGCSGHGIQQAPAIGRAIMELIIDQKFETIDLSRFKIDRIIRKEEAREENIV